MAEGRTRVVLGGRMHGQRVTILHGSTMVDAVSGDEYRRHGVHWWVPKGDTENKTIERIDQYLRSLNWRCLG